MATGELPVQISVFSFCFLCFLRCFLHSKKQRKKQRKKHSKKHKKQIVKNKRSKTPETSFKQPGRGN